jgi:hypothetical protein
VKVERLPGFPRHDCEGKLGETTTRSREDHAAYRGKPANLRCQFRAAYRMNGKSYCIRHAEQAALKHLLKE